MSRVEVEEMPLGNIEQRISKMEAALNTIAALQTQRNANDRELIEALDKNVQKLNEVILGDGVKPGLAEQVRGHGSALDKISEKEQTSGKHIWAIWIAVIAGAIDFIFRLITHKGP